MKGGESRTRTRGSPKAGDTTEGFISIESNRIPVISYENLIQNKEAAGRARDLADVDELRQRREFEQED